MNIFDLLVMLTLLWAVWRGWQRGFVLQAASLAGLVLALFLAAKLGPEAGRSFGLDPQFAATGGFVVVLLAVLIGVALIGQGLRKLLHFAGLGMVDTLLGILVAVIKYLLLLSVLFAAVEQVNEQTRIVEPERIESSICFRPVVQLSDRILPFVSWVRDHTLMDEAEEWDPSL